MSYEKVIVEYVSAECDAEGCNKVLTSKKLSKAYSDGWLFYIASRGDRKVNKAFCPQHRDKIVSSIDQFFDTGECDE